MDFLSKEKYNIFVQIIFWSCLLGTVHFMLLGTTAPASFYYLVLVQLLAIIVLVFWNTFFLVPQFFTKKKYGVYILVVIVSILFIVGIQYFIESNFFEHFKNRHPRINSDQPRPLQPRRILFHFNPKIFFNIVINSAVIMTGTLFKSIQLSRKHEKLASQLRHEKLETEMKFLKSQINPHFLFNALNNVYTLSLIQSEQTPEVVMKLSEMLRYMLYKSNQKLVPISQEINYIKNYIALQQLKDDLPLSINTSIRIKNRNAKIAPLILIPFIENAIKHSKIEDIKNGWITIELFEKENYAFLKVSNSVVKVSYTKDATGGIGLQNVKRRLELQYPDKHQLDILQDEQHFEISLSIQLS